MMAGTVAGGDKTSGRFVSRRRGASAFRCSHVLSRHDRSRRHRRRRRDDQYTAWYTSINRPARRSATTGRRQPARLATRGRVSLRLPVSAAATACQYHRALRFGRTSCSTRSLAGRTASSRMGRTDVQLPTSDPQHLDRDRSSSSTATRTCSTASRPPCLSRLDACPHTGDHAYTARGQQRFHVEQRPARARGRITFTGAHHKRRDRRRKQDSHHDIPAATLRHLRRTSAHDEARSDDTHTYTWDDPRNFYPAECPPRAIACPCTSARRPSG